MAVDKERQVQDKVIDWFIKDLGYTGLGNLEDVKNTPIKEELLRKNLKRRGYKDDVITKAINELQKELKNDVSSMYQVNQKVYSYLRYGKAVKYKNSKNISVHFIDWNTIEQNDFYIAEEVTVVCQNGKSTKRPDIVLYVNGIALVVLELKRSLVSVGEGVRQNIENQKEEFIRKFFGPVQLLLAGSEAEGVRYGVIETPAKYYLEWREEEQAIDALSFKVKELIASNPNNKLRAGLISLCHKERLLSLIHDFMIFDAGRKKTARHNQYFANIAARERILAGEGGVIWNTQGSGKSLLMVWFSQWIRENVHDSRVVIITDREELDEQIKDLFYEVGEKNIVKATSGQNLRNLLNGSEARIICSLIHKYGHHSSEKTEDMSSYIKELSKSLPADYSAKGNIVAFIDECHRTNSGKLHRALRVLMPNAILIGFTGTPLLKKNKQTTIETFGTYIHKYTFDQGVADGVVLDLRYESRDVDQSLKDKDKIDKWFELKTVQLTDNAKQQLKQRWTTMNKLYSSKDRLQNIAQDIIFDMETKPRLQSNRGTAMLVANSILEACKYWEIFQSSNFKNCAVVTSFDINKRNETIDVEESSEEDYKKSIYERMLKGKKLEEFEREVKTQFKKEPSKMKLLIVVDKLLTGYDAPSATYLYIDKSMRDHDLFQAICRVNRPDGDDKDYGYIVDYKDLFRNVQLAMNDYTGGAFEDYSKEDVEGLIKNRFDEAKAEMEASLLALQELLSDVGDHPTDSEYIAYFCRETNDEEEQIQLSEKRQTLYTLVASFTRTFANCSEKLVSGYGYLEMQVDEMRQSIHDYNQLKQMIKIASCDYIDLKPYEADMRFILDTYIKADNSKVVSQLGNLSLVQLLLDSSTTTPIELIVDNLPGDAISKPEIIDNNVKYEIVKKMTSNPTYYGKLSNKLAELITQRKIEAISYEEYLRQVLELAKSIMKPEETDNYPDLVKGSAARRNLYDMFNQEEAIAIDLDNAIRSDTESGWKNQRQKQMRVKKAIATCLEKHSYVEEEIDVLVEDIFDFAMKEDEYRV